MCHSPGCPTAPQDHPGNCLEVALWKDVQRKIMIKSLLCFAKNLAAQCTETESAWPRFSQWIQALAERFYDLSASNWRRGEPWLIPSLPHSQWRMLFHHKLHLNQNKWVTKWKPFCPSAGISATSFKKVRNLSGLLKTGEDWIRTQMVKKKKNQSANCPPIGKRAHKRLFSCTRWIWLRENNRMNSLLSTTLVDRNSWSSFEWVPLTGKQR